MENFVFMHPQKKKYILGKETQKQVGEIIHGYGIHKVMIHFGGGSVKRSGLLDEVINSLREQGIDLVFCMVDIPQSNTWFCRNRKGYLYQGKCRINFGSGGW